MGERGIFKQYPAIDLGADGYPFPWKEIKRAAREQAGNRCLRCRHPYQVGGHESGEWSPCDEDCRHPGPMRVWTTEGWVDFDPTPEACGAAVVAAGRAEAQWRILTVHHLNRVKADCRWWNLVPLCQRCHLEVQGRVRMEQVYPYEHSSWFKPYAAGFYAHSYLGEDLTREEVEERLDELLALERAA